MLRIRRPMSSLALLMTVLSGCVTDEPGPPPPGGHPGPFTSGAEEGGSDGGVVAACDVWSPGCGMNAKCMPVGNPAIGWTAAQCSPVSAQPASIGDPCTMPDGPFGGIDDCEQDAFCYFLDAEQGEGKCLPFCTGSPEDPICPVGMACGYDIIGTMATCLPLCDPLVQDCEEPNTMCRDVPGGMDFACYAQGGIISSHPNQPCSTDNGCPPGAFCAPAEKVSTNPSASGFRCAAYCDVSDPLPNCPGPQQECLALLPGAAGSGAHYGACFLP
jgi:hypothetical protein